MNFIKRIIGFIEYKFFGFDEKVTHYSLIETLKKQSLQEKTIKFVGVGESNQIWWETAFQNVFKSSKYNFEYENILATPGRTTGFLSDRLNEMSDSDIEKHLTGDRIVLTINEGINDAIAKNHEYMVYQAHSDIIKRIKSVWLGMGKLEEDFLVIAIPAHPTDYPRNSFIKKYIESLKVLDSVDLVIDLADHTNYFELKDYGLYKSKSDVYHLNDAGYLFLVKRMFNM